MILITSYYEPVNIERLNEIKTALEINIKNPYITKIYLLNDKIYNLNLEIDGSNNSKINQVINPEPILGFKSAILFGNTFPDEIIVVANSDVSFDDSLQNINKSSLINTAICLTRYDNEGYNKLNHDFKNTKLRYNAKWSQDTWIFQSPLKINTSQINFTFGVPGCDGRIAQIFHENNLFVYNPCFSIKSHHHHSSNFRPYKEKKITNLDGVRKPISPSIICDVDMSSIFSINKNFNGTIKKYNKNKINSNQTTNYSSIHINFLKHTTNINSFRKPLFSHENGNIPFHNFPSLINSNDNTLTLKNIYKKLVSK